MSSSISETVSNATSNIVDIASRSTRSGKEPPSGQQGKGTVDQPYDQGNAPEVAEGSGIEPPSGQEGKGTVDSPYDQGNAPAAATTVVSPSQSSQPQATSVPTPAISIPNTTLQPSPSDPLSSPSTTHQGSGNPLSTPSPQQEAVIKKSKAQDEKSMLTVPGRNSDGNRGRGRTSTGTAANGGDFDAGKSGAGEEAQRIRNIERDVSPGCLDDGTHVRTSGQMGGEYQPSKINRLKDKFHFGKH